MAAPGVAQKIAVSGTGIAPILAIPAAVSFGRVVRGTTKTITIILTNPANNVALTNLGISVTGENFTRDAANPGTCGASLAGSTVATTCTMNVDYSPTRTEATNTIDSGTLAITGASNALPQSKTVSLQGAAY